MYIFSKILYVFYLNVVYTYILPMFYMFFIFIIYHAYLLYTILFLYVSYDMFVQNHIISVLSPYLSLYT